ncbi:hypothetical protein [Tepidibacter thalassicus]|uniref:Phage tail assembly chaperone protein, E, or 41 or 14 n=1 Tax=Tepidibacter thalassicus DSM 15285 TaxID=1123350 RepID=A0A1M5NLQ3_9FIRM|nr:hypothetical protein [Tepidibacter thalassicus]SHG90442.1 hypothetical protein SAMN02744040_00108 [Tepidibacter thalassicus DSM 15285]
MSEEIKNVNVEATEAGTEVNISKEKNGVYVHEFKKPFEYEGKKFETLNFYFDKLTGKDMIAIETEMQAMGEYALAPEISRGFQCRMAAKAGNIGADALESMPLPEFNKITNAARDFLISSGY